MSIPLLSVCLITYNHVKYIRDAIEGVLIQKVSFTWELIIADDFSTDGTREIILEYKAKYPNFIKLIFQKKNIGPTRSWLALLNAPKSKYIAYFEGDDYWTDPCKLQKQVNILEENPNFSLCFHNAIISDEKSLKCVKLFNPPNQKKINTIEDVIRGWIIPSASLMFRTELLTYPEWIINVYNGDYAIELILADQGPCWYINEAMSIYRKNASGVSSNPQNAHYNGYKKIRSTLKAFNNYSNKKYDKNIKKRLFILKFKSMVFLLINKIKIFFNLRE